MFRNRITMYEQEQEPIRLPHPSAPAPNPSAFVLVGVPAASAQEWTAQQWIYQQALAAAEAVMRPSILDRDLLGVWN
jgi:hypothetical protein